ncbi:MAG: hypothetical protein ACT4PJ_06295 [Gemmatimonadaceae bacterium]
MRRLLSLSALVTPIVLAACLEPDPVPESNYGVIGLNTVVTSSDTILSPEALFYRSGLARLPTSRLSNDACQIGIYPPPGGEILLPRFLDAGESIAVSTASTTHSLFPTIVDSRELYLLPDDVTFPFRPGEVVTVTVPGAPGGFSNGTISLATAAGFTFDAVEATPLPDEALPLSWSPAGDDSTKMLVQLRYGVGQLEANQQIFCELIDDGAATVPPVLLNQWRNATTGSREVSAARWRVRFQEVSGGVLIVISSFEIEGTVE